VFFLTNHWRKIYFTLENWDSYSHSIFLGLAIDLWIWLIRIPTADLHFAFLIRFEGTWPVYMKYNYVNKLRLFIFSWFYTCDSWPTILHKLLLLPYTSEDKTQFDLFRLDLRSVLDSTKKLLTWENFNSQIQHLKGPQTSGYKRSRSTNQSCLSRYLMFRGCW
jgi:hypothetical protein